MRCDPPSLIPRKLVSLWAALQDRAWCFLQRQDTEYYALVWEQLSTCWLTGWDSVGLPLSLTLMLESLL